MEAKELDRILGAAELRNPKVYNASRERYVAEISFKAGYEQGWNDNKPYLPDANEPWDREQTVFEDGKQAGRREVVEWIEAHLHGAEIKLITSFLPISKLDWQAKLKEWGLSESYLRI